MNWMPWDDEECLKTMKQVNAFIVDGAVTFLKKEYTYLSLFCGIFGIILIVAVDMPWATNEGGERIYFPLTTFAFLIGSATSMVCGYIGMKVATASNVKVTYLCASKGIDEGFDVAFRGGQVLGFCLVGLSLIILEVLILCYKPFVVTEANEGHTEENGKLV